MNADLLRAEIAAKGFTLKEVAVKAGMSRSALSAKMNGHRMFTASDANRILDALEISDNRKKCKIFLS